MGIRLRSRRRTLRSEACRWLVVTSRPEFPFETSHFSNVSKPKTVLKVGKHILPCKCVTSNETCKHIITSNQTCCSSDEELEILVSAELRTRRSHTASAIAKTRKLSLSTYLLSSAQCNSSFAIQPTAAPYATLSKIS